MTAPKGAYASAVSGRAGITREGEDVVEDAAAAGAEDADEIGGTTVSEEPGMLSDGVMIDEVSFASPTRFPMIRTLCDKPQSGYRETNKMTLNKPKNTLIPPSTSKIKDKRN